jgi:leucyl aminopeptidase (aminopeptidase T)
MRFGAEQAVRKCLRVRPGESVVLITDHATQDVAAALCEVLAEIPARVTVYRMEDFGPRPDDGSLPLPFPEALDRALHAAEVSIFAAQGKRGELRSFRTPLLRRVNEERHLRHGHMINIDRKVMEMGMSSDYDAIQALSARVHDIVRRAQTIHVSSPLGTDFTVKINPDWKWLVFDGHVTPGEWKNLPDGEVLTCAESADGRAVIDGCLGDHFTRLGSCAGFPVTIDFAAGVVTRLSCPARPELERELLAYIAQDDHANRIGEFAIGTNTGLREVIGNLLQDEKIPGVHVALGHGYPERTGSPWHSNAHLDVVMLNVSVEVDGRPIMRDGAFLI